MRLIDLLTDAERTFGADCVTRRVLSRSLFAGRRARCGGHLETARSRSKRLGQAQYLENLSERNLAQCMLHVDEVNKGKTNKLTFFNFEHQIKF